MEEQGEHFDPTDEITLENIKTRAVRGIIALTGRTAFLNVITFISQSLLWAFLDPSQFGVFLVVSATVNFLSYFADIGLGAALVQKKDKPTEQDLRTVFTIQEALVVSVSLILVVASPYLVKSHSLTIEGQHLLYALTAAFFMASLKNIPSILLERKLDFSKFIIPQVVEQVIYNLVVVFLAWKGFGVTSFTWAVLIRGVVGLITIYILQPWRPGLGISKKSLRSLLTFGIPYQLNNFLATVKDDGMTIVIGNVLGPAGLGILGTAQKLAQYPLRFFMDTVTKVTFPAFSRMQDEKDHLKVSLTRSIFFICALVFPSLVGLSILFPDIINLIPKYQKWSPAYVPFILLSVNSIFAAFTTQLTNFLNSVGKIKITFKLMVMWTVLTWLLVPVLAAKFGVNGAAFGYGVVGISSIVALFAARKVLKFPIMESIGRPLLASIAMAIVLVILKSVISLSSLPIFIGSIVLGGIVYFLILYLLTGDSLKQDAKKIISTLIKR